MAEERPPWQTAGGSPEAGEPENREWTGRQVREVRRREEGDRPTAKRPFPTLILTLIAIAGIGAVAAAILAGIEYAVPLLVLTGIFIGYGVFHYSIDASKRQKIGDRPEEDPADRSAVPNIGFSPERE